MFTSHDSNLIRSHFCAIFFVIFSGQCLYNYLMVRFDVKVVKHLTDRRTDRTDLVHNYDNIYILSDSKGNYLRNESRHIRDLINMSNVTFWFRGGRTAIDGVLFLEDKLASNSFKAGRSIVLFWHVTCDINDLKLPERYLLPTFCTPDDFLNHLKPSLDRLVQIHKSHKNIDIGILESPPVFWSQWNRVHDHPEWKSFNDSIMHDQIDLVNQYIREINRDLNYVSPKFFLDCMEFRKRRSHSTGHRNSLTSALFKDGVRPLSQVSQKWLFQIDNLYLFPIHSLRVTSILPVSF